MKIYGTYVQRYIIDGNFTQETTLNGFYDLSFFLTYPEYQLPTLTVRDGIDTNAGKFLIAEYDETIISEEHITLFLASIPSEFNVQLLSVDEAKQLLRGTYMEETLGKFLIVEEMTGMAGEIIEAQNITIE